MITFLLRLRFQVLCYEINLKSLIIILEYGVRYYFHFILGILKRKSLNHFFLYPLLNF